MRKDVKKLEKVYFYNVETGLRLPVTIKFVNRLSYKVTFKNENREILFKHVRDDFYFNDSNKKHYKLFKEDELEKAEMEFSELRKQTNKNKAKKDLVKALEDLEIKKQEIENLEKIIKVCEEVLNG